MFKDPQLLRQHFGRRFDYLQAGDRHLVPPPGSASQLKFNIIGCGMIGMEHIRITSLLGRAAVHGLHDTNARSLQCALDEHARSLGETPQAAQGNPDYRPPKTYASTEAACTDPDVDALIISTPNYTHLDVLKTAITSGKPILLEKPMATNLADAVEIFKIIKNYPNLIQLGLQYRYKAIYKEAYRAAVADGRIGELKIVIIAEHRLPFLDKVGQWNKFSAYSGGTLVEKCCHYFDLFNYFIRSRPVAVSGTGSAAVNFQQLSYKDKSPDIIDNAAITVEYENGATAHLHLCMFLPMFSEEITICGTEGRLRASECEDFMPGKTLKTALEIKTANEEPAITSEPHYHTPIEESGHSGGTYFEHAAFTERILGAQTHSAQTDGAPPRTAPPYPAPATAEEGFWSFVLGAAAEEAVKTRRRIEVSEIFAQCDIGPADVVMPQ